MSRLIRTAVDAAIPTNQAPLSRGRERLVIGAMALSTFAIAINVNAVGALMPFLEDAPIYVGLESDEIDLLVGQLLWTTSAAAALASLLLGPVVDRVGRRLPMMVGTVLFAVAMLAHVAAGTHEQLVIARVLSGLAGGVVFTSASAAVADLVPYERRGAAMGLFSLGMFLATPVGLPIAIEVAKIGDAAWRWAFAWTAFPALLAAVGFLRLPADLGRSEQRIDQLTVLRQPHVVPALLSVLLYTGGFFTAVQFAPTWLDSTRLLPKDEQAFLWLFLGLSTTAGALVLPRIADRVGKRVVVLVTSIGVALLLVAMLYARSVGGLLAVGLPLTLLASARTPALQAMMSEIVEPRMRGTLMGLRAAAVNLGASAFGLAGSHLNASAGYPSLVFMCAGGVAMSYFLIRIFVRVRL